VNDVNYFLSYGSLILGTSTVLLSTFVVSYYFNLKPYTYLKSAVSTLSYNLLSKDVNKRNNNNTDYKNKYENKYFDEYDTWLETKKENTSNTDNLDNMYYSTIRDTINETYGDIIMCYDNATQSFAYYAKTANIPYKYLETAARKYVIETNADVSIYIDIRKEFEKAKNKIENTIVSSITPSETNAGLKTNVVNDNNKDDKTNEKENKDDDRNLFAKFKSYNTASNIPVNDIHTKKITELESAVLSSVNVVKTNDGNTKPHVSILRENSNRYSYRGKLSDYEIHHEKFLADRRKKIQRSAAEESSAESSTSETKRHNTNEHNNSNTKMSYQEFKKQMMESGK